MTYYEWITYLDNLKYNSVSDENINFINNSKITYTGDIKVRFLNHIVDVINYRLNEAVDNFLMKLNLVVQDQNNLILEISYIKKEMDIAKKLASIKYFEEETRKSLIENIYKFGNDMNDQIKNSFVNVNNQEISLIINNLDLNS